MSTHAEHFGSAERRHAAAELGMWVFLATELMFFGPLFLGYAQLRTHFPEGVAAASRHTEVIIGTLNTAILLTSSLFMALAVRAVQLMQRRATIYLLCTTAALGVVFLVLKGIEYYHEWQEHLVPWLPFEFEAAHRNTARLFYWLYFGMTGLHATHLTIGVCVVCVYAWRLRKPYGEGIKNQVEMTGLYWHFVDSMWVFLYPILYLVERHG